MRALDVIFVTSIITVIIALPFWIIFAWPIWASKSTELPARWREIIADISSLLFIGGVLIGLAAAVTSQEITHNDVLWKLQSIPDDANVSVNGTPAANSKELLVSLRSLDWLPAHHSEPTKRIRIDVNDHGSHVVLSLGRDSNDPREYWVFYPTHGVTRENEIGRIKTPLLDGY
jgi:hypothetical protein